LSTRLDAEERERYAKDLLDRAREDLGHAENKASILLAGVLAATGGITAAISGGHWSVLRQPAWIAVPFWTAAAATIAAVTGLAWAIYPRIAPRGATLPSRAGFFGDVAALESPAQLRELLLGPATTVFDIWVEQVWRISLIVDLKYRLICWSIRLLGCALLLGVTTTLGIVAHAS
jgi:Family of unknown function (DUF5706)